MFETVRIYWNIHKFCYSVQTKQNGRWRLWAHNRTVFLWKPKFLVQEGGRKRALREKVRNVHAFIEGGLMPFDDIKNLTDIDKSVPVHYDLSIGKFIAEDKPIESAYLAMCFSETGVKDKPRVVIVR